MGDDLFLTLETVFQDSDLCKPNLLDEELDDADVSLLFRLFFLFQGFGFCKSKLLMEESDDIATSLLFCLYC